MIHRKTDEFTDFQLLAAACVWIATKIQETQIPSVEDFVSICSNNFSSEEFCKYEKNILKALNFDIVQPTTETFTSAFLRQIPADPSFVECTIMFMYASVYSCDGIFIKPSHTGLAALTLAKLLLDYQMNLVVIPRSIPFLDENELEKATLFLLESVRLAIGNMNGPFGAKFAEFFNYIELDIDDLTKKVQDVIDSKSLLSVLES